jgi:hypothetical protein
MSDLMRAMSARLENSGYPRIVQYKKVVYKLSSSQNGTQNGRSYEMGSARDRVTHYDCEQWTGSAKMAESVSASQIETSVVRLQEKVEKVTPPPPCACNAIAAVLFGLD